MSLEIKKTVMIQMTLNGVDVIGEGELLGKCRAWLSVNWEGEVEQLVRGQADKLHLSWFTPSDKGGLGLFGLDDQGNVVCGVAYYESGFEDRKSPCFFVKAKKSTQCYW